MSGSEGEDRFEVLNCSQLLHRRPEICLTYLLDVNNAYISLTEPCIHQFLGEGQFILQFGNAAYINPQPFPR